MISRKHKQRILNNLRNLPVDKCLINESWQEDRFAKILVSRRHTNGKFSVLYVEVDLASTGVSYSQLKLQLSPSDYESLISYWSPPNAIATDYALINNIVIKAREFALSNGLLAYYYFAEEGHYMLEEDLSNLPSIDIIFRDKNNEISYTQTENQPYFMAVDIVEALMKNMGEGNFTYSINGLDLDEHRRKLDYLSERNKTMELEHLHLLSMADLRDIYEHKHIDIFFYDNEIYDDIDQLRIEFLKEHLEDLIENLEEQKEEYYEEKFVAKANNVDYLTLVEAIIEILSDSNEVEHYRQLWRDDYLMKIVDKDKKKSDPLIIEETNLEDITLKKIFGNRKQITLQEYQAYSEAKSKIIAETFNTSAFTAMRGIYYKMMNVRKGNKISFQSNQAFVMNEELIKQLPTIKEDIEKKQEL